MSERRARELFHEYAGVLNNEFRDTTAVSSANRRLREIAEELATFDLMVLSAVERTVEVENASGNLQTTISFFHRMWLMPLPPADQIPLERAEATSKIIVPQTSRTGTSSADPEYDRNFLKEIGIKPDR